MKICAALLSSFALSTRCEAFLGGVPRGHRTLSSPSFGVLSGKRINFSPVLPRLSASEEGTQERKKMVTADDLRSCQVRVMSIGFTVRLSVSLT